MTAFLLPARAPAITPLAARAVDANPARATGSTDRGVPGSGPRADPICVPLAHGLPAVRAVWRAGARVA